MKHFYTALVLFLFSSFIAVAQPVTYNFTGSPQVYVVPDCVQQIQVVVAGAKGGGPNGGNGARVTATLNVTPGQELQIFVGGQGGLGANSGGWNGGGTGHPGGPASGGGGGASDVRVAPYALANRVVVAGGGGGRGGGATQVAGGIGACPNGNPGTASFGGPGGGGTQFGGGGGGGPWGGGAAGTAGTSGQGAPGAADPCFAMAPGGGGGGGLFGGGGGGSDCCCPGADGGGGGGAGSSLVPGGATCLQGNNAGNGFVTITPVGGIVLTATPANPTLCAGQSVDITVSGATTYTWNDSPSLNTTQGNVVTVTPPSSETLTVTGVTNGDCEATLNINVTVNPLPVVTISPENPSSCNGDPVTLIASGATVYLWSPPLGLNTTFGSTVQAGPSETTTYTVTGALLGCQSQASVTVALEVQVQAEAQLCTGEVFFLADGTAVATGGTYVSRLSTTFGCDSIITLNLIELPVFQINNSAAICQGESFILPNGQSVNSAGTYTVTLPALNSGCDSTITTVLAVNPLLSSTQNFSICQGQTITLPNGQPVGAPGTYSVTLSSLQSGCDSTVVTNVTVNPNFNPVISASSCANQPYILPNGQPAQASGSFTFNFQTAFGCDSTVVVNYTQLPIYNLNFNAAICQGQSFTLPNGQTINAAGNYTSNLTTSAGCDSTITVNVNVIPLPSLNLNLASHYCPYNAIIPLNPAPAGGTLSGPNVQGNTLNHSGVNPGTYQVTYNYTDGNGCSNSASGNYQIPVPLVAAFSYETYCSDLFAENETSPNTANHQYAWTLDGSNISVQQNLQFRYGQEGTFNLTLTATDNFNCVYSTTQEVELTETLDLTGFFVANIITPNGDGINDELKLLSIFDDCLQYTLAIFNRWGQLVFEMTPESGAFKGKKSNGDDLPGGTYFYTLKTDRYDCDSPELKGWCNGQFVLKRD